MTFSATLVFFALDSTAKVVQHVTRQEHQQNLVFLPLAQNLVFYEVCIVAHKSLLERFMSGAPWIEIWLRSRGPLRTLTPGWICLPSIQRGWHTSWKPIKEAERVTQTVTKLKPRCRYCERLWTPAGGALVRRHAKLTCGLDAVAPLSCDKDALGAKTLLKPLNGLPRKHWTRNCILGCRKVTAGT